MVRHESLGPVYTQGRGFHGAGIPEERIIGGHLRGYLSQGFKSGRRQDKVRMHSFYQGVCRKCQTRDLKQRGHQKKEELAFSRGILERPSQWWSQVRWTLSD